MCFFAFQLLPEWQEWISEEGMHPFERHSTVSQCVTFCNRYFTGISEKNEKTGSTVQGEDT